MDDEYRTVEFVLPSKGAEAHEKIIVWRENAEKINQIVDEMRATGRVATAVYVHQMFVDHVDKNVASVSVYPSLTVREDEIRIT